jgi:hypothetical protein
MFGFRYLQFLEEHLGHLVVIMLTGMEDDVLMLTRDGLVHRGYLYELWPGPHYG